ncbi:hypothetical protein [Ancylobacter rudongensis]|uniref:Uncharacterized protein n=1 Tax=Ancylobacter rudongensis TaxID=177413 RepID=A0A1G4URW8_9HYPH|nr:hypothetical protein [Ancylobacter rudongensis]SCW95559.1 hypothetical protein SAMN05660859_0055 [Ancylobacter rudongensis]
MSSYEVPIRKRRLAIDNYRLTVDPNALVQFGRANKIPAEGLTTIKDPVRDRTILEWDCLDLGTDAATYEKLFDYKDFDPV